MMCPDLLRRTLDGVAEVTFADPGTVDRLVEAHSPLRDREDAILTPHAAWDSEEVCADLNETVATGVHRVLEGEDAEHAVDPDWT